MSDGNSPIFARLKIVALLLLSLALVGCGAKSIPIKNGAGVEYGQSLVLAENGPQPVSESNILLGAEPSAPFTWDNATVYFVMTDRFYNGNLDNDKSYGRRKDGKREIGTFHGGDLAGLTHKINEGYFNDLGVNALWITAPYQQMLGWVVGADNGFKHYAYHGYYALDFTVLDANMGTNEELRTFVDTAHENGIRVVFDIVMNHPGYADLQSLSVYGPDVLWEGWERANLSNYHKFIAYNSPKFKDWWGKWIRADLPGSASPGSGPLKSQLAYLPDFRTESTKPASTFPTFLLNKPDSKARPIDGFTVRQYLVKWLTDWVREYGIDGFRCDTAKHVELEGWQALKTAGDEALAEWKSNNPDKVLDDNDFWMTGEVWAQGVYRNSYFDSGFDSLINFDFQKQAGSTKNLPKLYDEYASSINSDPTFNVLSYISSHDTRLFSRKSLYTAGTSLLLAPGAVQIFYGDETARPVGPAVSGDRQQGTRSDMNWESIDEKLLLHWQKLGQFRHRHPSVGAGVHNVVAKTPFAFSRILQTDKLKDAVVIAIDAVGTVDIDVKTTFGDVSVVRDAYTGLHWPVVNGFATLQAHPNGVVLLEQLTN